jgi:prepilin-type N-terminal cleavage/methylation domain-containing protein
MKFSQRGFTLIELLLYIGLLSILLGVLSTIFGEIVDDQLQTSATSSVNQDGRYLLSKLLYDASTASASASMIPASPGTPSSTMQLTINSINYTYSLNSNNNLQVVNNTTGQADVLNSYNTSISGLTFLRIGNGGSSDTVRISFTVTGKTVDRTVKQSQSFQTTLGIGTQ